MRAPLARLDDATLEELARAFGGDVLGGFDPRCERIISPADRKDWRHDKPKNPIALADVVAHLRGEMAYGARGLFRSLVIDVDSPGVEGEISRFLRRAGLPFVAFTSPSSRGPDYWIRCENQPTDEELAALRWLFEQWIAPKLGSDLELFPKPGKAIKFPLGLHKGEPFIPVQPRMSDQEMIRWLAGDWARATPDAIARLVHAATRLQAEQEPEEPAEQPDRDEQGAGAVEPPEAAPRRSHTLAVEALDGFPCKQQVALEGFASGRRHVGLNAIACELAENGETDADRLTAVLLTIPRPHSDKTDTEHRADAQAAARDAIHLKATSDPRRFSGCPRIPVHSGHAAGRTHRSAFEHHCTDEAKEKCPILARWRRNQEPAPWAQAVLDSTIWRGGQGAGKGFGGGSLAVYRLFIQRAGSDPDTDIEASRRFVVMCLADQHSEKAIRRALTRLETERLIVRPDPARDDVWRLVRLDAVALAELERRLGTADLAANERQRVLDHWKQNTHFRP